MHSKKLGRKAQKIELTESQRAELEKGYRGSQSVNFSRRCHIVLLKSEGRSSKDIASIFGISDQSVNSWVKRYRRSGIEGLHTRPGQGRKPILDIEQDADKVKQAVQQERQRLSQAKILLEQELDKEFSLLTLKRFLKNLTGDGSEFV